MESTGTYVFEQFLYPLQKMSRVQKRNKVPQTK